MIRHSKKYLELLTSIILALAPVQSNIAQKTYPQEMIRIGTDRDLYIVGEEINFKLYTIDGLSQRPVHYSDVVFVELLDRQNSPLIREKFQITQGESSGKLILPSELTSDHYLLRAYTNWMKNAGAEEYAYQLITVVNPFEEIRPEIILKEGIREIDTLARTDGRAGKSNDNSLIVRVKEDNKSYFTRQKVILDIEITNRDGTPAEANLMLTLAREGLLDKASLSIKGDKIQPHGIREHTFPPEWGGHIVSGNISEKPGGNPMVGDTLLFSVVGKSAVFDYAVSDNNGNFRFLVNNVEGLHEMVIQHVDPSRTNYQIHLHDPFSNDFVDIQIPDFYLDTNMAIQINQAIINSQISALYGDEIIPAGRDGVPLSFYGSPEFSLRLDDYLRLPEMNEVFFELIPSAQMRGKGEETSIRLKDEYSLMFSDTPPLLLLDGVVIHDASLIAGLDARKVERIDLVNRDYYYGLIPFKGILNVVTADGNCPITLPEQVFRQSYEFISSTESNKFPAYTNDDQIQSTLPDFRNTLYWDPCIRTDKNGRARVEFFTGDDVAEYTLMLTGISGEGKTTLYSTTFSVRKN